MSGAAARPPLVREFSSGGLVYGRRRGAWAVVLAARRGAGSARLTWTIPKGHVEPGEHMTDAAVREVREETGLEAAIEAPLGDITYWYARRDEQANPVRIFKRVRFYLMCHRGGRFADRDAEMDAVRWFTLDEAARAISFDNERALIRRAHEILTARDPR